jgi:hypothetical protein
MEQVKEQDLNNLQMYADFLEETSHAKLLETEHGFATYRYEYKQEIGTYVYILDIYVKPEKRNGAIAADMANQIAEEAKENDVNIMVGSVDLRINGAERSQKVLKAYGMEPAWLDDPIQYYIKEI